MEVVASLSQGRTAAAQCGLFTHKSVPVIFEPPFTCSDVLIGVVICDRYIVVDLNNINACLLSDHLFQKLLDD